MTHFHRGILNSSWSRRAFSGPSASPSPFTKVFIINLAHRRERLASVMHEVEKSGLTSQAGFKVVRFDAVDGGKLNPRTLVDRGFLSRLGMMRLHSPKPDKIWGMDLSPGGVGCAMSHVLLWARIAAAKDLAREEAVLIVEDDSVFPQDGSFLTQFHDRMRQVPSDWNFVYVGGLDTGNTAHKLRVGTGVSRVPQLHRTTNCYLIRPEGARQLLSRCVPFTYQIDTQMTAEVVTGTNGVAYASAVEGYYTMQPPLVAQAGSDRFLSDIQ